MSKLNWGMISDGGIFESLVHAILFAKDHNTLLFARPGRDAGQDARSADGTVVYQAKYRQGMTIDRAIPLVLEELEKIKIYREKSHPNYSHWEKATEWVLVANFEINTNDHAKWESQVVPVFRKIGLEANYWSIERLDGELITHPEIHAVFFDGENRVLVGIMEARNIIENECVGSGSLDKEVVGRESNLQSIRDFVVSNDKCILPVIGVGGVGKSRLLYESLLQLSKDGWRVFWALPESMSRSSKWFHFLNGTQKTCVVIDGPENFGLMKAVLEQLSIRERKNWKAIFSCRTEKEDAFRWLQTNKQVDDSLRLEPLNGTQTKELLRVCLDGTAEPSWAHGVFRSTNGVPRWTCLIAELIKRNKLHELPDNVNKIASMYVESCLEQFSNETEQKNAKTILHWLSLWGTLSLERDRRSTSEIDFLNSCKQISPDTSLDILQQLVKTGLVKNYGVDKRCYSVNPAIIRRHILCDWLFDFENSKYVANSGGRDLVQQLADGTTHPIDSVLKSLSHLAMVYLDASATESFLTPLFDELESKAREVDARKQQRISELVDNIGKAIPDHAVDVLRTLRQNEGQDAESESLFWGKQFYTHNDMISELPWILFCIAEHVTDSPTAKRFVCEFQEYVKLEDDKSTEFSSGKSPRQLVQRILRESKNSTMFAQPACEYALEKIADLSSWHCVGLVCECLLDPIREHMDWVERGALQFSRHVCLQGSCEWVGAETVRKKIYELLENCGTPPELRSKLWQVLANAHGATLRAAFNFIKDEEERKPFIKILEGDLKICVKVLTQNPTKTTLQEAEEARKLWEYHLRFGKEFVKLAENCEKAYAKLPVMKWKLHEFFSFDNYKDRSAIKRTVKKFKSASDYQEFFTAAKEYLEVVRNGKNDLADNLKIADLADVCIKHFNTAAENPSPLVEYVQSIIESETSKSDNEWAWRFVVYLYQQHIAKIKRKVKNNYLAEKINELLDGVRCKDKFLFDIYANSSPNTIGQLTQEEFDVILKYKKLDAWNFIWLLGVFTVFDAAKVKLLLQKHFNPTKSDSNEIVDEKSRLLGGFIRSYDMSVRRYESQVDLQIVEQIISIIVESKLDGRLFGLHDIVWLCERSQYRMSMMMFCQLIKSRIELDLKEKPYPDFVAWPDDFELIKFVTFDATKQEELDAFNNLCSLVIGDNRSFIASYSLPKYVCRFDTTGQQVKNFVDEQMKDKSRSLRETRQLAKLVAIYPENSDAWTACASLICKSAQNFSTADRVDVYYALENTSSEAIVSAIGEVANHYYMKRDDAKKMYAAETNSALKPYWKWALERAESRLHAEQDRVEEANNE